VPPHTRPNLQGLDRAECLALLSAGTVGRIGLSIGALPVILPVNYVAIGDGIVFRTVRGTKLSAATHNTVVAFEVDDFEDDGNSGWSVLVRGIASETTDPEIVTEARAHALSSWALDGLADHYVLITTDEVTGRRFDHDAPLS
jgi:nitroimidazol reductase NimA-like FMN-containing flavoprotein (pyridoxamine 5'-phosphate oxidase superfamily)